MKNILLTLCIASTLGAFAQPKGKAPSMAPIMTKGYYLTMKGDTIKGEIQTNPDDPTALYTGFNYRAGSVGKVAPISSKKAKGYGFDGRHFILVPYDNETSVYIEQLATGRVKIYLYKFNDKKDGEAIIASSYYVQDSGADEKNAELKELKPISTSLYKKQLKPYMKDQEMTWTDLDKFVFNKDAVVKAINEFNKFYAQSE